MRNSSMAWLGAEYVDPDAPRMSEVIQLRVYPRVIPKDNALLVAAISAAIHSRPRDPLHESTPDVLARA